MIKVKGCVTASVNLQVSFHEMDPMEVVWHGNYLRYFEVAREKLLEKIHYGYPEMRDSGYAWPVVDVRVKYRSPLSYAQKVTVIASIIEYENRLRIQYDVIDVLTNKVTTTGYTIQMAVNMATRQSCFVCPDILIEKIESVKES